MLLAEFPKLVFVARCLDQHKLPSENDMKTAVVYGVLVVIAGTQADLQAATPQVPQLACAGGQSPVQDILTFTATSTCSDDPAQKQIVVDKWVINPQEVSVTKTCPHNKLTAESTSAVTRACIGLADGVARLVVQLRVKALAGYQQPGHCDGGNYCGANASVSGSANTTFNIDPIQVRQWCIGVVSFNGEAVGVQGYPNSSWFVPYRTAVNNVALQPPSGGLLQVGDHATYLIDEPGVWRVMIPANVSHYANMAEVSGEKRLTQELVLKFSPAKADGTCPVPFLEPLMVERLSRKTLPATGATP